jgi:protein-arginine kinase activator protein McsA
MNDYYTSFSDVNISESNYSREEMETYLNAKLESLIDNEKYEEAARLRDHMVKNKIKRIK